MLYCFTKTTVRGGQLAIKEKLAYNTKHIVVPAGADFALTSQLSYVETVPTDEGEVFVPPTAVTSN